MAETKPKKSDKNYKAPSAMEELNKMAETMVNPKESVKKRNSPVIGMNGYNLEKGDNTKYLALNVKLFNMPNIDLNDSEAVIERLTEYFNLYAEHDMKPTVAGMAMALNGHRRQWLTNVVNDRPTGGMGYKANLRPEVASVIKKAYGMMEQLWEQYMTGGKINPVTGIFLAKNNFNYVDKQEHVVTPNVEDTSTYNVDEIRNRYVAPAIPTGGTDEDSD